MAKKIIVEVKVISKKDKKKGEVITVSFPLEKSIYDAINASNISDEEKIKYFTDYYTDWYTEDNYQKSHIQLFHLIMKVMMRKYLKLLMKEILPLKIQFEWIRRKKFGKQYLNLIKDINMQLLRLN